jgi:hypothetical protein
LTINPHTGLPEAGFLEKLLPAIAGAAAIYFTGGAAAPEIIAGMSNPATLGLGAAALGKASGKSVAESIQLGMGVYGGAGLAGLASTAGTAAISAGATPAIASPVVPTAGAETALAGGLPSGAVATPVLEPAPYTAQYTNYGPSVNAPVPANLPPQYAGPGQDIEAQTISGPPPAATPAPAAPAADVAAAPSSGSLSGPDTSSLDLQNQQAVAKALAEKGTGETMGEGLKAIANSPGKYMNMGTAKMGLAALSPALMGGSKLANKPAEGNIRDFDFDPITGKYRKLRTTPVSQYNAQGMASGGVTSLLSFADGGKVDASDPAALRAAIQAGPQTQDALNEAYMTYTPAQLQAAFPEYGTIENYNAAAAKAYSDMEIKAREAGREAMFGPGGSSQGRSVVVSPDDAANPNRPLTAAEKEAQRLQSLVNGYSGPSKLSQAELDAGKAAAQQAVKDGKLSQADYDFLVWRTNETDPMMQIKIGDVYARQGTNPFSPESWGIAKEANAKTARQNELYAQNGIKTQTPEWLQPNGLATQKARNDAAAAAAAKAAAEAANSPFRAGPVVGPSVAPTGGGGSSTAGGSMDKASSASNATDTSAKPTTSKAQLQSYFNSYFTDTAHVPVGTSQAWAGGRITKISPTEAQYVPPGGGKAISLTQGMDVDKVMQLSPNIASQWQTEYGYSYTPQPGGTTGTPAGPRVGTVTGSSTPTDKATMQGYYDQYFTSGVPVGYSQSWGGGQLVKNSANTALYTDSRGNSHIMEKGMDVNSVYAMSPDIAAQWNNEFLYTANPDQRNPNAGPTTTATLAPFSAPSNLTSPYSFSKQGAMTPQGVMGGSEKGGTIANASQIVPAYQQYWQNAPVGSTVDFAGGKLSRTGGAQAVYTGADGKTYSMSPTSDLNIIAAQNPAIAETWRNEFGMVPQNYMTGESARNYEFLKGNEPYSVNQQTRGIARPYGEMALGLPGATFGNDAIINQRDINDANAAIAKETADGGKATTVVPAIQRGYGVTDPGTYNMQTVYDPGTQRYVSNNMYETPGQTKADAAAAAAIPTPAKAGGGLMALGGMTGIAGLGDYSDGGRLLRGPGDGVSDSIPATIGNKQQARLADGEFVVPARIVSELGNGSTEAGARQLYAMMDRIQKNRSKTIGKNNVAVNSKAANHLPA